MNVRTLNDHLKNNYTDVSAEFGLDGTFNIAYDGPKIPNHPHSAQPGVVGSAVVRGGAGIIFFYPRLDSLYPHYSLVDGNPHYTDENKRQHTIDNQNVINYLQQYGEYQVQGGGAKKKRKKRKTRRTRRKKNKRKTNKRRK